MIGFAHHLNMSAIAQGIESAELQDCLVEMDCDFLQGNFIAPPMPLNELEQFFDQQCELTPVLKLASNI